MKTTNELILVVGASGMVGAGLVKELVSQGQRVRATSSRTTNLGAKDGVETVHLNLITGEGLRQAFEGVDRAFFLSPPGYADQYALLSPLIQEAKRRSLKKVVLMTAMGANAVDSTPFRRAELELEKSGLTYNIIRPNWFLQNFQTFWIQGILSQGKIMLPAGSAKTSFIDARDISAVAAKLLTDDRLANKDFDLTGPTAVDHAEVASEISRVSGKAVSYEDISPEAFGAGLLAAGLPKDYAGFLQLIMGYLKEGYAARTTDAVRVILGREPLDLASYAKDNRQAWA